MKIFISWSGAYSHGVAMALRDWLKLPFPHVQTFVSSEDIRKGKRWLHEISSQLTSTNFGIVCLTPDNFEAPWIVFEAGALSKLKDANVCTLLLRGLRSGNIEGPLSHFQHTTFNKGDVYKMLAEINEKSGRNKREEAGLKTLFERLWPDLDKQIVELPVDKKDRVAEKRPVEDMVYELLEITRTIARNFPREPRGAVEELSKLIQLLSLGMDELEFSAKTLDVLDDLSIPDLLSLTMMDAGALAKRIPVFAYKEIREKLELLGLGLGMEYGDDLRFDVERYRVLHGHKKK